MRVLVNTNGLAVAQDDAMLELLRRHRERVEVYLQYDGESAEASTHHRGADIRRFKERAIERLSGAGVFTTLTMTAALGVNDDEIGFVIKRALDTPYVGGVTIQPVFGSGRSAGLDPMDRLTHTGVLARLEEQTAGQVTWRDLTALPCSHPHCCSVGYLLRDDSGSLEVARRADRARPAQAVARPRARHARQPDRRRRASPTSSAPWSRARCSTCSPSSRRCRTRRWRTSGATSAPTATSASAPSPRSRPRGSPASTSGMRRLLGERVLRVTVKPFMDMNTMIEERLTQCCVHVATVNADSGAHQCAPFCAVQAWAPLSRSRISTAVGLPLVPAE